jgi:hypothetical protein
VKRPALERRGHHDAETIIATSGRISPGSSSPPSARVTWSLDAIDSGDQGCKGECSGARRVVRFTAQFMPCGVRWSNAEARPDPLRPEFPVRYAPERTVGAPCDSTFDIVCDTWFQVR